MSEPVIRILLVDDEPELVDYLAKRLKKKGHEVVGLTSGKKALELVRGKTFDVAVLDLKMPEMDGIELLKQIRQVQPYLQAMMLTGHGSMDSALESGRCKAFRFLVKPFEFDGLLGVIREAWEQKRSEQRAAFQAELKELIAHCTGSQELMHETRRLRKEYEQEG